MPLFECKLKLSFRCVADRANHKQIKAAVSAGGIKCNFIDISIFEFYFFASLFACNRFVWHAEQMVSTSTMPLYLLRVSP